MFDQHQSTDYLQQEQLKKTFKQIGRCEYATGLSLLGICLLLKMSDKIFQL
jgi:hypothetical protein